MHLGLRGVIGWSLTLLLSLSCPVGEAQEHTVFVRAKTAQLRSGTTSLHAMVTRVHFSEPLQVLQRQGNWLEVRTSTGSQGWIFVNKITATAPSAETGQLAALGERLRQTTSAPVTAATGARGLDKVATDYAEHARILPQHQEAVDRMTTYQVSDDEVEAFLHSGRLGEYAE